MTESSEKKEFDRPYRRRGRSLFGPIILIAIGVYFLLYNMGVVSGLNWIAALQLWPLILIFIGLNIVVRQAPGFLGSLLSGLVAITAVLIFGYVLLFAEDNALLNRLGVSGSTEVQTEQIEFANESVRQATVDIDLSAPGADIYALEDSVQLIEGTVTYTEDLIFDTSVTGDSATILLDTRSNITLFNFGDWASFGRDDRWQIGLNPGVEMDLGVDVASGSTTLDLVMLTLSHLRVEGGSGSMALMMPDGDYDAFYDAASGSSRITLPGSGRQTFDVEGGSGSLVFYLPESMEARLEVEDGSGSFNPDERFTQISGDERDEGVWETAAYEDAPNRITLNLDIGSGSVRIQQP